MAIRPIDLQQVVLKSVDVARDQGAAQQQAAAAQQSLASDLSKRQDEKAETVQQFDEAGQAAIHDRGDRSAHSYQESEPQQGEAGDEDPVAQQQQAANTGLPRPRVGRHIDVQA